MSEGIILSIDAMGGDYAPEVLIHGIEFFLTRTDQDVPVRFLLHGDKPLLEAILSKCPRTYQCSEIRACDKSIAMDMAPAQALRQGKGSSMWNAIEAVKNGEAGLVVSAGNTGALMAMSKLILKMKHGVRRPAIAAAWPSHTGMTIVLDVGANIECDAEQLVEFAVLGEAYFRALYNKPHPSVGLLNVGTEELKGHAVLKAAHERLSEVHMNLNYVGYVEGSDIAFGKADVVVTDGFTGNIAIKTAEGTGRFIGNIFRQALQGNIWSKITTLLNFFAMRHVKKKIDPRRLNGGVLLGLNGIVIKSHGGTDAVGFAYALNIAAGLAGSEFLMEIERRLTILHDEANNIGFIV